jgi:hypothetical protein
VSNQSVYLANGVIWVEGITDVMYIRRYLEVYKEWLKVEMENTSINEENKKHLPFITMNEGLQYAFAFSGGNLLKHFQFGTNSKNDGLPVESLTNRFFIISDDGNKPFFDEIENEVGDKFHKIEVKEIENTLSQEIVKQVVISFSSHKDAVFNEVNPEDWEKKGLGYLIHEVMLKGSKKGKDFTDTDKTPKPETTTISSKVKVEFARKATEFIETSADLSLYAKEIMIPRILDFILKANPK